MSVCYSAWQGRVRANHQEGRNNPVDDYTEEYLLPDIALGEYFVEALVSDFAEDGIHHDEQTNR